MMTYRQLLTSLQELPDDVLDRPVLVELLGHQPVFPEAPVWGTLGVVSRPPNDVPGDESWPEGHPPPQGFDYAKNPVLCGDQIAPVEGN